MPEVEDEQEGDHLQAWQTMHAKPLRQAAHGYLRDVAMRTTIRDHWQSHAVDRRLVRLPARDPKEK